MTFVTFIRHGCGSMMALRRDRRFRAHLQSSISSPAAIPERERTKDEPTQHLMPWCHDGLAAVLLSVRFAPCPRKGGGPAVLRDRGVAHGAARGRYVHGLACLWADGGMRHGDMRMGDAPADGDVRRRGMRCGHGASSSGHGTMCTGVPSRRGRGCRTARLPQTVFTRHGSRRGAMGIPIASRSPWLSPDPSGCHPVHGRWRRGVGQDDSGRHPVFDDWDDGRCRVPVHRLAAAGGDGTREIPAPARGRAQDAAPYLDGPSGGGGRGP